MTRLLFAIGIVLSLAITVIAQRNVYICNAQGFTCQAAYDLRGRIVIGYTGPLFRLVRTGGGGGTQDIGQLSTGFVNTATVGTFCGAGSTGPNAGAGANTCAIDTVYDQTANAYHMTLLAGVAIPYSTTAQGWPQAATGTGALNNAAPTNVPTGNADRALIMWGNDTTQSTTGCGVWGLYHATNIADVPGTDDALIFQIVGNYRDFGGDLEQDASEQPYGLANNAYASFATISGVGDFVGMTSYANATAQHTIDFNGGLRIAKFTYTAANGYHDMNVGGTGHSQVRLGAGGDGCSDGGGIWYGGIVSSTLPNDGQRLNAAHIVQDRIGITRLPSCTNAPRSPTVMDIQGVGDVFAMWGLRQADPHSKQPIAVVQRADTTKLALGPATGTCDFDAAAAATFCVGGCTVIYLTNQAMPAAQIVQYTDWGIFFDDHAMIPGVAPALTFNCLGAKPCLDLTGSGVLTLYTTHSYARPYSLLAVFKRPSGAGANPIFCGCYNMFMGGGSGANTFNFQADSGGGSQVTASDNVWHAFGGTVGAAATTVTAYVDGTGTISGTVTTTDTTNIGWSTATGYLTELWLTKSAASSGNMNSVSVAQHAYWGF